MALTDDPPDTGPSRGDGSKSGESGPVEITKHLAVFPHAGCRSVVFSPDGKLIAAADDVDVNEPLVRLTDVETGRTVATLSHAARPYGSLAFQSLSFSADGKTLAGGGQERVVLWDVATSRVVRTFSYAGKYLSDCVVAYSPKGAALATAGAMAGATPDSPLTEIHIRNAATGRITETIIPWFNRYFEVTLLEFSADGTTLAVGSKSDQEVSLWNAATGQATDRPMVPGSNGPTSLTLHPDGERIAIAAPGRHFLRSLGLGEHNTDETIKPKGAEIWRSVFSPDGRTLALLGSEGDRSGTVWLWDVERRRETVVFHSPRAEAGTPVYRSIAFSPDGSTIAVGLDYTDEAAAHEKYGGQQLVGLWKVP